MDADGHPRGELVTVNLKRSSSLDSSSSSNSSFAMDEHPDTEPFILKRSGSDSPSRATLSTPNNKHPTSSKYISGREKSIPNLNYYGDTDSHQFEVDESEVWRHNQLQRHFEDRGKFWTFNKTREVRRWTLTLLTGFCTGAVALFVTFFTKMVSKAKLEHFKLLIDQEKAGLAPVGSALVFLLCSNLALAYLAFITVYMEPLAAGSGIPEVKCFLNGIDIPHVVHLKTLIFKAIGIIFACSSGLPLGKEGPMVHIGAVVAAGVSQGDAGAMGLRSKFSQYQDFRNDREKRDFVACGAAAGVAAAFGAPIGGVLFSLEEGASFWSTKLTWRCFFCAMMTVFTLFIANSVPSLFGHSDNSAMFSFGEFFSLQGETANYSVWELSLFMLIGAMGGIIGATFNTVNSCLFTIRTNFFGSRIAYHRMFEVLLVTLIMTMISYFIPVLWARCTELPVDMFNWSDQEKALIGGLVPLYCPAETHYNELASLYLTDSDTAIKQLFHFREIGDKQLSTFSSAALTLFFVPYTILACIISGISVPAGMFVPSLLSGAAFGRLVGHVLHKIDRTRGTFADSGTYALMGAAAVTGGIARMTISLTVMILEGTGDMQYVLPLMLTVMVARLIGNTFNDGLYDIHIHNRKLYFLDEDEVVTNFVEFHDLSVVDIMTSKPVSLKPVVRVGEVFEMLSRVDHHCFPVVDRGVFCGTIMRKVICTLIKHKAFGPADSDPTSFCRVSPLVNWGTLECAYPKYPTINELSVGPNEYDCWLDLRPYVDVAAYSINEHASVQRTYRMFRTLGLRHLCVTDRHNQLLGMITRADLVSSRLMSTVTSRNRQTDGDGLEGVDDDGL